MTANKLVLALASAVVSAAALANPNLDAIQWLQKISLAAQKLNYSGTFVYLQQGGQPQTSRITHVLDGGVERERLETMDGAPVIVVRSNDEVRSYHADTKTVLVEKRRAKATFPALAATSAATQAGSQSGLVPSSFSENYVVRKWDIQRIAGLECQVLLLEPKDGLRYTHKLWADMNTGLLLKAQAFNEKGDVVEQIGFTQVEIGGAPDKYLSKLAKREGGRDWRVANAQVWEASLADAGWKIEPSLPGFRKISEMKRGLVDGGEVGQVVFSDGLTSVSVFVEPARSGVKTKEGISAQGAVNVYRRAVADHVITVLGEAPPACVTRIAKAIEFRPAQASSVRINQ